MNTVVLIAVLLLLSVSVIVLTARSMEHGHDLDAFEAEVKQLRDLAETQRQTIAFMVQSLDYLDDRVSQVTQDYDVPVWRTTGARRTEVRNIDTAKTLEEIEGPIEYH